MVKCHGFFALLHQVLGESIEHLEKGRSFGYIFDAVSFKSARAVRAFLAPNFKSEIHCLFHLVNRFGLFVTAGGKFHILVDERLLVELRVDVVALILPDACEGKVFVVAKRFAIFGLVLDTEMTAT